MKSKQGISISSSLSLKEIGLKEIVVFIKNSLLEKKRK